MAIAVRIDVVGRREALIDGAVAVVVHRVADLVCVWTHVSIAVVAVLAVGDPQPRHLAGGTHGGAGRIAVAIVVRVRVEDGLVYGIVVRRTVAVVVLAVADLDGAGEGVFVRIIAVRRQVGVAIGWSLIRAEGPLGLSIAEAVIIGVGVHGVAVDGVVVHGGVAVVVDTVTHLGRRGVDEAVRVITVQAVGGHTGLLGIGERVVAQVQ